MTTINKPNWIFAIGFPVLIFIVCCIVSIVPFLSSNKLINTGIVFDLTISAPIIYYLFIQKTIVSKFSVARVFIIGVCIASFLLHNKNVAYLGTIKKWIVPTVEIFTIYFIVYKFNIVKKSLKKENTDSLDFLVNCRNVLIKVIGNEKLGSVLASEFAVVNYALIWKKNIFADNVSSFSYHKKNNTRLVIYTFMGLILIETIACHFLFSIWNKNFAWIFTSLSLYTCIQLFAHAKAMKHRPIQVVVNNLFLYNGLAGDAVIAIGNIGHIVPFTKKDVDINIFKLALLKKFEKQNIIIYLKQPINATTIFGIKKNTSIVSFYVDNPNELINAIKTIL